MAMRWVAQAWKKVKTETICKCFRSAGVLDSQMAVVSCDIGEDDPFADIDENADLQDLITEVIPEPERCQEYVNGDDDLATCNDTEDEKWDENFMSQLTEDSEEVQESESEDDEPAEDSEKITSFKDAIVALEDVQKFLENRGHMSTSLKYNIGPAVDELASLRATSLKQCTLDNYFTRSS